MPSSFFFFFRFFGRKRPHDNGGYPRVSASFSTRFHSRVPVGTFFPHRQPLHLTSLVEHSPATHASSMHACMYEYALNIVVDRPFVIDRTLPARQRSLSRDSPQWLEELARLGASTDWLELWDSRHCVSSESTRAAGRTRPTYFFFRFSNYFTWLLEDRRAPARVYAAIIGGRSASLGNRGDKGEAKEEGDNAGGEVEKPTREAGEAKKQERREKRRKERRRKESEEGEETQKVARSAIERVDSASRDVLLTVMSLSSPKVPRRHCINLLLPTPPYWKFYRALHSFCRGRLLYPTIVASHISPSALHAHRPNIPRDKGELPAAFSCVSSLEERALSCLSFFSFFSPFLSLSLSLCHPSTRRSFSTMIDNVINHRIGKSVQPLSPPVVATDVGRTNAYMRIPHTSVTTNAYCRKCTHPTPDKRVCCSESLRDARTSREEIERDSIARALERRRINSAAMEPRDMQPMKWWFRCRCSQIGSSCWGIAVRQELTDDKYWYTYETIFFVWVVIEWGRCVKANQLSSFHLV